MARPNMEMTVPVTSSLKMVPQKVLKHGLNFMEQTKSSMEALRMVSLFSQSKTCLRF